MILRIAAVVLALAKPATAETPLIELVGEAGRVVVTLADIISVQDAGDALFLSLGPTVAPALADLSGASVGTQLSLRVCGEEVSQPRIMDRLPGTQISLPGRASVHDRKLIEYITGAARCP
jgi:hypothetical protein